MRSTDKINAQVVELVDDVQEHKCREGQESESDLALRVVKQ